MQSLLTGRRADDETKSASAVIGVAMGTESTKLSVATGDYNDAIDARIAEIKRTCGIQ